MACCFQVVVCVFQALKFTLLFSSLFSLCFRLLVIRFVGFRCYFSMFCIICCAIHDFRLLVLYIHRFEMLGLKLLDLHVYVSYFRVLDPKYFCVVGSRAQFTLQTSSFQVCGFRLLAFKLIGFWFQFSNVQLRRLCYLGFQACSFIFIGWRFQALWSLVLGLKFSCSRALSFRF